MPPERSVFQFFPFRCRLLLLGEVVPPSELLEHLVVELGIAVPEIRAHAVHALGEQVHAVALHAEARPEGEAAVADRHARVVEDRGPRMSLLGDRLALGVDVGELGVRVPPRGPRHPVEVAVGGSALGAERGGVEGLAVLGVQLQPLGALAGVADRPHPLVDLAGDVLDVPASSVVALTLTFWNSSSAKPSLRANFAMMV